MDFSKQIGEGAGDAAGAKSDFEHTHLLGVPALADIRHIGQDFLGNGAFAGSEKLFVGPFFATGSHIKACVLASALIPIALHLFQLLIEPHLRHYSRLCHTGLFSPPGTGATLLGRLEFQTFRQMYKRLPIIRVKDKYQLTRPAELRKESGIEVWDAVDAKWENGKITLTPKSIVDRIPQALKDVRAEAKRIGLNKIASWSVRRLPVRTSLLPAISGTSRRYGRTRGLSAPDICSKL